MQPTNEHGWTLNLHIGCKKKKKRIYEDCFWQQVHLTLNAVISGERGSPKTNFDTKMPNFSVRNYQKEETKQMPSESQKDLMDFTETKEWARSKATTALM